ncbi:MULTISPECIES: YhgE/Pip domain-containing protein [Bifidobacterium]|uniref:Phage infection protein n=1 Tax=Bifidobacterium reuteri DSM 23975 TaxID=1437610 RepID=A0A087CYF6_9BIFI|nr:MULTISPECIES: YhgE/Pip domain-containing protein [Bifidobacterium]KFI88306.1 phage infection protein [Bifidobacterium reuteri DSM 23975]TPF77460.1 phage infection protein [Bifidobacterium sp. UTCIF-1]TPF79682.1 phage infection protein [Bifidobacterium sp. UTCIF-24]TPF82463.1 phage infection protein [Bifidobacterium sp. UTCIF-3]TPF88645.1 phage infection protein [Bifidobacterium sp. UTBIF-56]
MSTMWKLFTGDVKRLTSNVVSIIIVIGLTMIPGLFTWFNVAACWDPFSNMSNLKFAVANTDSGYKSDLIPMKVVVGDQVVNALRANSQLDWTITSKDDAIDGAKSGKYYAAIVIPESFSEDMMTFFSDDVQHAKLTYYRNEKKNALAPNLLNEGTDEVASQINTTFAQTITAAGLEIASSLADQLSTPEAKQQLTAFNANVADFASQLDSTADMLGTYSTLTDSAQTLLDTSNSLIKQASGSASTASKNLKTAKQGVTDVAGALNTTTDAMGNALDASASSFGAVSDSIDALYQDANNGSTTVADELDAQATAVADQITQYTSIRNTLAGILGEDAAVVKSLDRSIARQTKLKDALNAAATDVRNSNADVQNRHQQVKDLADQAKSSIAGVKSDFATNVKPQIESLSSSASEASGILQSGAAQLKTSLSDVEGTSSDAKTMLTNARTTLDRVSGKLRAAGDELSSFNGKLADALNSGDMGMVKEVLGNDPEALASTLAAPVQLKRTAVFPVENFGSSMAPFYTLIPLWVGALLMVVTLKTTVSRKTREALGNPRPHQLFLGHYGVFALIALMQSTVSLTGDLLFLHVQAVHPLLFMLSGWLSSLVFSFFTYTAVVSFGNVGKAIGVLMLIVQISGANAAYPVQVLPDFISKVSPFLPLTHSVTMMRAAIAGIYDLDYWRAAGMLLAFVPPLLLLGLLLRKPLVRFNQWYVAKVESTKVLS